jgi:type IV pilus assembly protein PilX
MNPGADMNRTHATRRASLRGGAHGLQTRQQGVVLFIALMVMVVLSLAGIALVRSVDTFTAVSGNIAFRQASTATMNLPVERAVYALFDGPIITDKTNNLVAENYYASQQPGENSHNIPAVLQGQYPPPSYPGGFKVTPKDAAGNEIRYVIERMCTAAAVGTVIALNTCELASPKLSNASTAMKIDKVAVGHVPFYRVTIRVDGPANTTTYAQAMLR